VNLILPAAAALALASCGGASPSTTAHRIGSTAARTATPAGPTRKIEAAVQSNIRATLLTDAKVSCPSQPLPGKDHSLECQLSSHLASGTLTLTQQDAAGRCFLYTGRAGPYSWTVANKNIVCGQ
jgi:hypothetical protein